MTKVILWKSKEVACEPSSRSAIRRPSSEIDAMAEGPITRLRDRLRDAGGTDYAMPGVPITPDIFTENGTKW